MSETLPALDLSTINVPVIVPTPRVATSRVLHVINGEHYSGAERVQDLLAQELPDFGFEVGFACVKPERFPDARQSSTPLYRTPMKGRFDLECGRNLAELIRRENYSLVHAHTPRSLLAGAVAAKHSGVPLVYHVHSPTCADSTRRIQNFVNATMERWLLRHASKLIAVSPSLADLMTAKGFAADRIAYVANGVPAVASPERRYPTGAWTLGMAALFRPRKGIEVLLEAMAVLRRDNHNVRLRVIGPFETPGYETEVRRLVERLALTEAVDWTGFVGDVHAELCKVDLFVLPSLFGEGLPMVVLEAMATGLPVIASRVEGIPIAIRDFLEGRLVEPNNPRSLAEAIHDATDPARRSEYQAMSRAARQRHGECFSAKVMAAGVAEVYREVLNRG